ncbi:MAG TPA: CDP-6-deoxy-delta-3,4-glucoseen reductase [Methylophilaceae bacterium]|nr:CDP-6-deoxy-delta-3,4-glucoseen reductase [Methylophilaceae bacterium]
MSYRVTVKPSGHTFEVAPNETILQAALEAGINLPYGCRDGACGACKGRVLEGQVDYAGRNPSALTDSDKQIGHALFCSAMPLSDLIIESREILDGNGIRPRILPVRVQRMEKLSHDVMAMYLKLPSNERLQFMAGQYVDFLLKDGKRRAFSLANAPHKDDLLELHMRLIPGGQFTEYVFREMPEKTIMRMEAPLGTFYLREESDKPIIFVAGGTGFAPIKGIIEHMLHHKMQRPITLYWGARSLQDIYMPELPGQWANEYASFTYIPVLSEPLVDDQWQGRTGLVHEAVLEDRADLSAYQVYCCGSPQMVEAAHVAFQKHGMPEDEFFSDAFTFSNPQPLTASIKSQL